MADLTIAFDPGSTSSRAFCTLKPYKPELLLMDSAVAKCTQRSIESYVENRVGNPAPETDAWIEYQGQHRAVGPLAKEYFGADINVEDSKLELATWKTLAVIGAIAQNKGLSNGATIRLGLLLPFSEYEDRKLFEPFINEALAGYRFRGEERSFELESFVCCPEGFGIVSRGRPAGESLRDKKIVVVMVGYRDASVYTMRSGVISGGKSEDMGFHRFIQLVQERTSRLPTDRLIAAICNAGPKISTRALGHLFKGWDSLFKEAQLSKLRSAIAIAQEQYWLSLSDWIRRNLPPRFDEVIVGGGTAHYYEREFNSFFSGVKPNWGAGLEEQLNRFYLPQISRYSLSYRLPDNYGFFHYVCGTAERTVAYA